MTGWTSAVVFEDSEAADSGVVRARHVVVAVPPTLAGRIRYLPPLPASRDGLTQQIPAGALIKFQVGYETPFWREDGLSGLVASLDDAFNPVMDNSPPDASCGVLVGFLEGRMHGPPPNYLSRSGTRSLSTRW